MTDAARPLSELPRSTVLKGLVWSVPAVAAVAAAPVAAASPWVTHTVAFRADSTGTTTAVGSVPAEGAPADVIRVNSSVGPSRTPVAGNLSATGGGTGLTISSRARSANYGGGSPQTVTLTFPVPVRDVRFTLRGIDTNGNAGSHGFHDTVVVTPSPVIEARTGTVGNATASSPLTVPNGEASGSARVVVPGPVTSVTIALDNQAGSGVQSIVIADMTYLGDLGQY
ncbi:hypothetical protein [Micrococcus sp.]|uniref:hypothetical protein n=1 Tax=Micrococcus sp. TaxID=1271 RepID=UPI002A90B614|nr:hypothetical protein [Micrococcus sp.]MDY6054406.1 hypothetical protein [Micrococcus sp.]